MSDIPYCKHGNFDVPHPTPCSQCVAERRIAELEKQAPKRVFLLESDLPKTVCSGYLSKGTRYTLKIDGKFSSKEAAALLKLLTIYVDLCTGEES